MRAYRANNATRRIVLIALIAILASGCKPKALPDADSTAAKLYVSRCGNCHAPYNPREMTASMWETQVMMMEVKMQAAGQPPLTPDQRDAILQYLKHNAGTE
jgi:mono/diheme cytochrome c family protein